MIEFIQVWDNYTAKKYIELDNDIPIYGYTILKFNSHPSTHIQLESVYVNTEYRGQGYFNLIMKQVLELDFEKLFIQVKKDAFINKKYRAYGFRRYDRERKKEDEYEWLRLIKKSPVKK